MYDVVVVGFGAAGACAAIEAAEAGARVLVVDRFGGGGATAISGGVVYAGGGTRFQRAAGIEDDPERMYEYLLTETRDAVTPRTLRRFCEQSADMMEWLADHGVPFDSRVSPEKTSYPTNRHYLYVSGNEDPPLPRGHRTHARGTSGHELHRRLAAAARAAGAEVRTQTRIVKLTPGAVECRVLTGWPRAVHQVLHRLSVKPGVYLPSFGSYLHRRAVRLEDRYARPSKIRARTVVLAAGGFVFDREMMRAHAPAYRGGLRLGTHGDDGSGIRLGLSAGGVAGHLDRVTVWRFLTPPSALTRGLLVDRDGRRICDESRYGAAIGDAVLRSPEGKAWLLVDAAILRSARRQVRRQTLWFQRFQAWWMLGPGKVSGPSLEAVARKAGVDPGGLIRTVAAANGSGSVGEGGTGGETASREEPGSRTAGGEETGRAEGDRGSRRLTDAPFSLIDVSIRGLPAPMLTLGGLRVDEETGGVVEGIYAAGRNAVGICSGNYVSGLSLADCVFSGRRAGVHAAAFALAARSRSGGADAERR